MGERVKARLQQHAQRLKRETYALYLAYRDRRTPGYARAFTGLVVAYAVSPIDLIPDFIPMLGYLDDLIIIPAGIYLALRMIPPEVMAEAREAAQMGERTGQIEARRGTAIVLALWAIGLLITAWLVYRIVRQ